MVVSGLIRHFCCLTALIDTRNSASAATSLFQLALLYRKDKYIFVISKNFFAIY